MGAGWQRRGDGGQQLCGVGSLFSSSFYTGRSCWCGFCCLWRGAASEDGSVSPACPSLPGEGCPVAGVSAAWPHVQRADCVVTLSSRTELLVLWGSGGVEGWLANPSSELWGRLQCHPGSAGLGDWGWTRCLQPSVPA